MESPTTGPINVIVGHLTGNAALDTALSRAILERVDSGHLAETLQVGMPHPVVAFGKHDTLADRFPEAVTSATDRGYDPVIRIAGGRAVVFHPGTVRFAWTLRVADPASTMHARFDHLANAVVDALASLGVDTVVGERPGEYCPGSYSVHLADGGKVMGVGQRLTRSAAQVGGVIVVEDAVSINDVLVPVYKALGIPMDPAVTGCVADARPVDPSSVADALVHQLTRGRTVVHTEPDGETVQRAHHLRQNHVPAPLA